MLQLVNMKIQKKKKRMHEKLHNIVPIVIVLASKVMSELTVFLQGDRMHTKSPH